MYRCRVQQRTGRITKRVLVAGGGVRMGIEGSARQEAWRAWGLEPASQALGGPGRRSAGSQGEGRGPRCARGVVFPEGPWAEPAGGEREGPGGEAEAASWGVCAVWEQRCRGSRQETALEPRGAVAPSCGGSDSVAGASGRDPRCRGGGEGRRGVAWPPRHGCRTHRSVGAEWRTPGCAPGFAPLPLPVCAPWHQPRKGGDRGTSP